MPKKKLPFTNQGGRKYRAGRESNYLVWRCFFGQPLHHGIKCTNRAKDLITDIPVSFFWTNANDRDGLKKYIDLLMLGRLSDAAYYETIGAVKDIEQPIPKAEKEEYARVSFDSLINWLRLGDERRVPLWGRIRFVTNGVMMFPAQLVPMLAEVTGEDLGDPRTWKLADAQDLKEMGLKPADITSGMYLDRPRPVPPPHEGPVNPPTEWGTPPPVIGAGQMRHVLESLKTGAPPRDPILRPLVAKWSGTKPRATRGHLGEPLRVPAPSPAPVDIIEPAVAVVQPVEHVAADDGSPPHEVEVSRRAREKHFEIITSIRPANAQPYYAKRIGTYQGEWIWVGTSFHPDGPWRVSVRDNARLLALGISP